VVSKFGSGEAAPNAELLSRVDGVVPAGIQEGTVRAEGLSRIGGLRSEFGVFDVLREKYFWEPFARYFTHARNFEHELAVWVSVVEHRLNRNGDGEGQR